MKNSLFSKKKFFYCLFQKNCFKFSDLHPEYNSDTHSLLTSTITYQNINQENVSYVIKETKSDSLIIIDPQDKTILSDVLIQIQESFTPKKIYLLFTKNSRWFNEYEKEHKFIPLTPETWCISGQNEKLVELQPYGIGDLCICLFNFPGIADTGVLYAITQVNQFSTKIPIIFSGENITSGGIGYSENVNINMLYGSLAKLRSFVNETLVYPSLNTGFINYKFNKFIDPDNALIDMKFEWIQKNMNSGHNIKNLSSSLFEERKCNPFLRANEKYFIDLIGDKTQKTYFQCYMN